jgi:hypothetical protein
VVAVVADVRFVAVVIEGEVVVVVGDDIAKIEVGVIVPLVVEAVVVGVVFVVDVVVVVAVVVAVIVDVITVVTI